MKRTSNFTYRQRCALGRILVMLVFAVPVYAESSPAESGGHVDGLVTLSPEQVERAGIGLAQVQSGALQDTLTVYGTVTVNPENVQRVSARFDGIIRKLDKRIGDTVKRGETILTVESNESMQDYTIAATIDGVVTHRDVNIGEQTNGRTLLVIEDLSAVWVELALFPQDLAQVHVGQKARIRTKSRNLSSEGVVTYIAPSTAAGAQTVLARVPLLNTERDWTPGQFVVGDIVLSEADVPLLVSTDALQILDDRPVIFVQIDKGFEPRPVQLGRSNEQAAEVLDGLSKGETYVTKNSFILKSELGKEGADHGH